MMALLCVTTAWAETTIWSENWSSATVGMTPSQVSNPNATYSSNGSGTKIYNEALAGGTAPELLVAKSGGSLTATITLNGASGEMTLEYNCNKSNILVTSTTNNVTIGSATNSGKIYTRTVTVPQGAATLVLTFTTNSGDNARLDNLVLSYSETGDEGPSAPSGTVSFNPPAGEVSSGTTIAMSFSGTCDGIKYTLDGTSPSASNGTVYDASNPPAITAETTITAAAYNFSNNQYAFGTEATAAYTVVIPTVDYDGSVTFDATIDKPSSDNPKSITKTPVTFTCTSGTLDNGSEYRLFKDSETTFSVPNGYKIVKIEFTGDSRNPVNGFGTTQGLTFSGNDGVWIGEAQSVSFTASNNQVRCTQIKVYYTEPETTGPKYYLVGDFNGWANAITSTSPSYKFHENNGTYTLTVQDLPACEFKIIRSDNGTSAAEWYGVINGQEANIHHNHHTGIGVTHDNGGNFRLQSAGTTSFSFEVNGGDPFNLTVTRDPILYIQGFDDWNNNVAMTQTSTGWTIPKTIAQGQEFRFVDEFGQQQGWNGGNYYINGINGSIDIKPGENVFVMNLSGDFVLNVNEGITTLNINEVDLKNVYTLVQHENDLVAGGEYIIAGGASGAPYTVLMGADFSSNYGTAVSNRFTYDASAKTMTLTDDCAAQVLTLGGSAGAWTFYTGTKYLSLTSSSNNLNTSDNADSKNAKWTIDVSKLPLSEILIANNDYTTRYIEYNSSQPRFACYTGTQQAVALFKRVAPSNKSAMPTITPGSGDVYGLSQQVEISQANGGAIYYTLDGSTPTANSTPYNGAFTVTATQFGQVITVTAIAIEGYQEASHPVSATYKFIAPQKLDLADIEDDGIVGETYTVNDNLQVVYVATEKNTGIEYAFARDMGTNSSIAAVVDDLPAASATGEETDPIDFMKYGKVKEGEDPYGENPQVGPWQQNNWVRLDISGVPEFFNQFSQVTKENPVHIIIKAGRLFGQYTDNENYTIKVTGIANPDPENDPTFVNPSGNYVPNVYCPANFHSSSIQQVGSKYYWFMPPKPMEVFEITWALWYDSDDEGCVGDYAPGFYMQTGKPNEPGPVGGVGADMSYNNSENVNVVSGASYRFRSVAMTGPAPQPTQPEDAPLRDWQTPVDPTSMYPQAGSTLNKGYHIAAVDLNTENHDQVITGVSEVKTGSEVVSVTYCDLAGRMSQKPFAGVNIIVTRYSDGTVKTTKAIK